MIKNYKVRLHVLTPIHIGMGDCYDPTQFVFDKDGHMWVFDTNDFLKSLSPEKSAEFCKLAASSNNSIPVFRFFRDNFDKNKVKCRQVKASSDLCQRYDEILASGSLSRDAINQFELKRTIFNPIRNVPYIPGSSLKGCLKTFWMSENNRHSEMPIKRNCSDAPGKFDLKDFEKSQLNAGFSEDPFRFVKISDLYPVKNDKVFDSMMMYAVMFPKKSDSQQDQNKASKRASLTVALEVIPKGNIFEGVITLDDQEAYPKDKQVRKISMEGLMQRSQGYYILNRKSKDKQGNEKQVPSKTTREINVLKEIGGAVGFNCAKELWERVGKDCFPVRLGHHSSAEFITIDGCRSIKITPPQVRDAKYSDHSTTVWLASSRKKPDSPKNLQAFGWALLEFEEVK